MLKILKFVYALINIFSLILLVTGEHIFPIVNVYGSHVKCIKIDNCPNDRCPDPFVLRCIGRKCYCS
ncbi:unnamed protein product [Trifolium pratense]|uniref:Uncharacterized protein n=1 Tax=Trifolium pratense TaxID=57577 RepID=A0ACB0J6B8_TRIPR|nr:unnamed protein product [Trifolium pratense]